MKIETENSPGSLPFDRAVALRIIGKVRRPLVLSMEQLREMDVEEAKDVALYCGDGAPRGRIQSCRGVVLEDIIRRAEVIKEDHNDTKKMFIVASAFDGYKVVFSWQEIFNSPVGGGVMVLVERDGVRLGAESGGMELISVQDFFTGARYVRGLETVEVLQVE